mmetsp:Transcript_77826/g.210404  ORF Transcript_77826/g.210404 Transcript_77826/m.210404 type:complete len:234 (+) Transcript_77826:220-921(+)
MPRPHSRPALSHEPPGPRRRFVAAGRGRANGSTCQSSAAGNGHTTDGTDAAGRPPLAARSRRRRPQRSSRSRSTMHKRIPSRRKMSQSPSSPSPSSTSRNSRGNFEASRPAARGCSPRPRRLSCNRRFATTCKRLPSHPGRRGCRNTQHLTARNRCTTCKWRYNCPATMQSQCVSSRSCPPMHNPDQPNPGTSRPPGSQTRRCRSRRCGTAAASGRTADVAGTSCAESNRRSC